jgi:hypothetical protein
MEQLVSALEKHGAQYPVSEKERGPLKPEVP